MRIVYRAPTQSDAFREAHRRSALCTEKFGGLWRFRVQKGRPEGRHARWDVFFLERIAP